jgi:hypothetical protein
MDMKKILQALDGVAMKPVEGVDSMAKFLRVVKEADLNQPAALPAAPKFYITQTTYDSLGEPPDFSVTDLQRGIVVASFDSEKEARAYVTQKDPAGAPQTELHQAQSKATAPEPNPDAIPQKSEDTVSPRFAGLQRTQHNNGDTTDDYTVGPMSVNQRKDAKGNVVSSNTQYDLGVGKLGAGQDASGIKSKSWAPASSAEDPISTKDLYAAGNKDKEATYDRAIKQVNSPKESIERFLSIVTESQGPLNRLTQAESIAIYHATPVKARESITSPVLNVAEGAKPSMIGKYFKTVEQEFAESADRTKQKATELASRVIEGLKDPKDNPCWKGYKPVGTKKKNGKTVPNCVPK